MAVKKNGTDQTQAAPAPEVEETVDLELRRYKRYYFQGNIYEAEVKYTMTRDQALPLLRHEEDGVPIFGRYRDKKAVAQQLEPEGPRSVDMTRRRAKPARVEQDKTDSADDKPKRIEVGTDAEFEALMADKTDKDDDGEQQEL